MRAHAFLEWMGQTHTMLSRANMWYARKQITPLLRLLLLETGKNVDYLEFKNVGSRAANKVKVVGQKLIDEVWLCFLWPFPCSHSVL